MKTTRVTRILIGLFGPSLIGSLIFGVITMSSYMMLVGLLMSPIFIGGQAIIYSVLMEFYAQKNLKNLYFFVGFSGVLGFASGLIFVIIDGQSTLGLIFSIIGLFTGLVLGLVLYTGKEEGGGTYEQS